MKKTKSRPVSASKKWLKAWGVFDLILLLFGGGYLLSHFQDSSKISFFELEELKDNEKDKIKISSGLKKDEAETIDWEKVKCQRENSGTYRYEFESQTNFWQKLIVKPRKYSAFSSIEPGKMNGKRISVEGAEVKSRAKIGFITGEKKTLFSFQKFLITLFLLWLGSKIFGLNINNWLLAVVSFLRGENYHLTYTPDFGFKDIGGLHEAKEELQEIVSYFRNPELFHQVGAKLPKGVLLAGPPGNGKTLLAKALAGECHLPFLFRSGSEFEEMVVGLGARRVRELFAEARSYPDGCVIFIDEIDSIGKKRNTEHSNDLTLNQLLNELDGFQPRENVVILAATNTPQILDTALLRPGRFDRQIYIPLPNLKARREIIALASRKVLLAGDVDLAEVATLTQGFSGAQIVNLFNEAVILSLRYGQKAVNQVAIFEAHDRVLMGPASTSHTISSTKRRIIAYHEAGHALVNLILPETTVKKITIVPRWTLGGYTWVVLQNESGDDQLINKSQILAYITGLFGGRASEELMFGSEYVTAGAYGDFKKILEFIQDLIVHFGMSDLGLVPTSESFWLSHEIPTDLSEQSKAKIATEREKILDRCWKKARLILRGKKQLLVLLAETLLQKNSLSQAEINYLFINQTSPFVPRLS